MAYVHKRGNRYYYVISLGRDPQTGKYRQITKGGYLDRDECERAARAEEVDRDKGHDLRPDKMTLGQYLDRWLRDYARPPRIQPSTAKRYRELLTRHVIPVIGAIGLRKVRRTDIRRMEDKAADNLSPTTVLQIHRILHEAYRHAVSRYEYLTRNPMDSMEAPRPARFHPPTITVADSFAIEDAADALGIGPLVRFAVRTGMRQGELFNLRWQDVDLGRGVINLSQHLKTEASERPILLDTKTVAMLQAIRLEQLKAKGNATVKLVFTDAKGRPWTQATLRTLWERLRRVVAMPTLRFHDLRHANATFLLQLGANPKVVQQRLGHASSRMTMDVYAHVNPDAQASAAEALSRLLERPEKPL